MTTQTSNWCNTGHQPCPTPHLCNDGRCYFNEATLEPRVPQEPFDRTRETPDWVNDPPEFRWSLVAWALLLVAGAFALIAAVL